MNGVHDVQTMFMDGRKVVVNGTEGSGIGACLESAGHILFDLGHAHIPFRQVVVKESAKVVHKCQYLAG